MGVPVRKLSLQGYKSFARRTEFIFERGITAIVGPNGSGKSNVSDALRWVLGEQAYSSLRSKRTEDMIFSGSDGHRRLGMAQVSLTFDNDEGWLPIDFSEVTISRRAHRSGGNEYLINGARVRLRDIAELLAGAGLSQRTYTVIGQGLVDRALALQSRDRRPLFEEAAGIVGYQMRRDEALGKLDETRDNLVRVSDIIAEITPRLSRLARQAEEAERHARLSDRLDEALRLSYGYRWHTGQERLGEAQALAEHQAALLSEAQSQLRSIQHETAQHEREVQRLQGRGSAIRRERRALERRLAELNRERAVREERERLLLQRQGESTEERSALQDQEATQRHRIAEVESALTELEARCQEEQAEIERLRAERAGLEQQRSHLRAQTRSLGQRARELFQSQAERQAEWTQVRSRRAALQESRLARQEAVRREQETADALREEQHALAERREELENQVAALEDRRHQVAEQQETLRLSTGELQSIGEELERDVARVTARRDLLSRLRQQAYHPGVQAVVSTAKSGRLARVRGLVAELLRVPAQLEEAIQAALGDRLQDVLVEDWAAAQRALTFLTESRRGRATLLPLNALRLPPAAEMPQLEGVIGRASDLVSVADELTSLATYLLGQTLIVQDLQVAERLLPGLQMGCQLVTLAGEVVRADRSLTGGTEPEAGTEVLAREREWRQLPGVVKGLLKKRGELARQMRSLEEQSGALRSTIAELEADAGHIRRALEAQAANAAGVDQARQRSLQALSWERERAAGEEKELASLDDQETELQEGLGRLEAEATSVRAELADLEERESSLDASKVGRKLETARTASAVGQEALRRERERLEEYRIRQHQMVRELRRLASRQKDAHEQLAALWSEMQHLAQQDEETGGRLARLQDQQKPIDDRLRVVRARCESLGRMERLLRRHIREYEERAAHASLSVARHRDELQRLQERILQDLGPTELEMDDESYGVEGLATQPPLPLEPLVTALPTVTQVPDGLEKEIRQLRGQLRRLRGINPEAPAEYVELSERHEFLVTQATDLEAAADSLRQVVAQLDQVMESRFRQTFENVAGQFSEYFSLLFQGGQAELTLTDPQDVSRTGVDIRARPPGKREQGLALLSGGERTLTAMALIFAILTVSPTPFCLLDEVDAMLDEANAGRFRNLLERLAEHTQFIVISHNRHTVEAADTIYGLSMDESGVSRVISLRIDEVASAVGA